MVEKPSSRLAQYPTREENYGVAQLEYSPEELTVVWKDGHTSRYNRFWLRDNCPTAGDKTTAIRSFRLRQMNQTTQIAHASLEDSDRISIGWKHEALISQFETAWLRQHCYEQTSREQRKHRPVLWDAAINDNPPTVSYSAIKPETAEHLSLLRCLVDYGVVRVTGLPVEPDGIECLEPLLAPFAENDFGRIFDLISEPDVWDLSQSSEALDPHSDDPYRYAPPGIRILFCVEASGAGGGESEITNGLAACEALRHQNPDAFNLLVDTPIPYIRYREDPVPQGADVHLRTHAPVIRVDSDGDVVGIRFHERSMATFDLPHTITESYYLALIELSTLINSGDFSLKHLLQPGEAFVFDNQQVLHGRTAFTGMPGRRHLRLCQMPRDLVHSRYRLLLSQQGHYGAAAILATGV